MKRIVLLLLTVMIVVTANSQTTYYWVGSGTGATNKNINNNANWNTVLNGTGTSRTSSTGATDILVFDGTNLGGATPVTGPVTVDANAGITCAQIKFVNNATINMVRPTSGTTTITMAGEAGEDFVVEAGSSFNVVPSTAGSIVFAMAASISGRVSGSVSIVSGLQFGFRNTTGGTAGSFRFTSGSSFTTNLTPGSAAYPFGNSTQSSHQWVVFEEGSHLYYEGGFSPHGSGTLFSAIDMKPGSVWHHKATNAATGAGNFFNRQSYGDIIVENNATLNALGTIYSIGDLTINTGCSFVPFTSGQTVVTGDILANGDITLPPAGNNRLVLAGSTPQTIAGGGDISVANLAIAHDADVSLLKNIAVETDLDIYGKLNFGAFQVTGNAAATAAGVEAPVAGAGNLVTGRYFITGNVSYSTPSIGKMISGAGITPGSSIVSFSSTGDSMYISKPLTATATGVNLSVSTNGATLATSNANGFDPATGSIAVAGNKTYGDNINYIINAATTVPFGITTGSAGNMIQVGFAEINAPVTVNTGLKIDDHLALNAKMTLRPLDVLHIAAGAAINGTFSASNYIATDYNGAGDQSILKYDGMTSATTLPVGTVNYYLPVTITPAGSSDFEVSVFEGITTNGMITGTALTANQKLTVVNAVWNINRTSGSGDAQLQLGWNAALEGATFTTLPDSDIGLIQNNGSSWDLPVGTGDNTSNSVTATVSSFGAFSAGAVPQVNPFVFNPLPVKTYGDPDFNGGATSLNTTQPIIYSSDNTAVATIVAGDIHIVGAGTATITASQATDGFYPAASVSQPLTVNKAPLTIKADDKTKFEGQANPTLTATYTGLVYNETPAALLTPAVLATTAVTASPPGTYPITVTGATSNNYDITMTGGVLTVMAKQNQTITFAQPATKTYGNADFNANATSTNNTIPLTYSSSNPGVATVSPAGLIHITGAGVTNITVSQAGNDGYFAATDVTRALTVNKVNLTVRVRDTSKVEGTPNPPFTLTYTGFVLGETPASLTTAPTVNTSATTNSSAGVYVLTPGDGVSQNYNFVYVTGRLTIYPTTGTDQQHLNAFYNTNGTLTVRVYSTEPKLGDIVVYDLSGRPLVKRNLFMPVGFIQTEVPIPTLTSGIYIVTVRGDGVNLKKMIQILK